MLCTPVTPRTAAAAVMDQTAETSDPIPGAEKTERAESPEPTETAQNASGRKPFLAASSEWTMGSGWTDCSTTDEICFRNTTDTAVPNFNKNLINGSQGFRLQFTIDYLGSTAQTTAGITLRVQSNTLSYFYLRVTNRGEEAMLQVDYCNNGTWQSVVPFTAGMTGSGGKLTMVIARESAHDSVTFTLLSAAGDTLLSQSASSKAWASNRFCDCTDLEFLVAPFAGYGLFSFSGYHAEAYPDDGIEPPQSASDEWTMGANWKDDSTQNTVIISNAIENAGPNFYRSHISAGSSFRVGFGYTGLSDYTTADTTLRLTSNNSVYLRMLVTQNSGNALVDVNFYDGANWTSIGSTGWLSGVGKSYHVTLEHTAGTETMRLILTKPDGTLVKSCLLSNAVFKANNFFTVSDMEPLVTTCGTYGLFSISGFTIDAPSVESANWSMGENWSGEYTQSGEYAVTNRIENAGPNFFQTHIGSGTSFRLTFLYNGKSDYTTADVTLRLTSNNAVYLRMLVTQNSGSALVDVNFFDGTNWTNLLSTGWQAGIGSSYAVFLDHTAGTDGMTLTLKKPDGSVFYSGSISNAVCTDKGFFSVSELEPLVTTCGNYGIFTITGFKVLATTDASSQWTLGTGWKDAGGYGDAAISNTTDTGSTPAVWKQEIDASQGAIIDFDFSAAVTAMQTTAELILRQTSDTGNYLRMVVTARGTQEAIVETSYYNGSWIPLDSSGWLSNTAINGSYHVRFSHQAGSADSTLKLTAKDGTILYTKSFSNAAITDRSFWALDDLQALFNPIPGYGCFTISAFSAVNFPATAIQTSDWSYGSGWAAYSDGESVYLAKTDKQQTEAVYTKHIKGQDGFQISFDISFDSQDTSSCYFKLRLPLSQEVYLFARVKGDHNQTVLEAQSYDSSAQNQWSTSLLSAAASRWTANNGTVTVHLTRKALSEELHYWAVDTLSGQTLIDETFKSDVLSAERFLDYNDLEWIFGADSGSPTFKIYHFTVCDDPAEPVAVTNVDISGEFSVKTGETVRYTAVIGPEDATVKSYEWLVDGQKAGTGATLNYLFTDAGSYTLLLRVTDRSGTVTEKSVTVTADTPEKVYALGDINADGAVDQADAELLSAYIVGKAELTQAQLLRADMNGDRVIDSRDTYLILNGLEE